MSCSSGVAATAGAPNPRNPIDRTRRRSTIAHLLWRKSALPETRPHRLAARAPAVTRCRPADSGDEADPQGHVGARAPHVRGERRVHAPPTPGSGDDPTISGATLQIFNALSRRATERAPSV